MKGRETRATILDAAMHVARLEGIEALSIGRLAERVGLSKSGLFAHFKSKEALQLEVLKRSAARFVQAVVRPAITKPRGEPRVRAFFENWLGWADSREIDGGCVFIGAAAELDDRPGPLRDMVVQSQREWTEALARAFRLARDEGHLRQDVDAQQLAFELYAIMMAFHLYRRLLDDPSAEQRARAGFEALLSQAK